MTFRINSCGIYLLSLCKANIEAVSQANPRLQKPKPAVTVAHLAVGKVAHNYSIQKENSTIQAWKLLHEEMAKVWRHSVIFLIQLPVPTMEILFLLL